jgi:hypothetical protein
VQEQGARLLIYQEFHKNGVEGLDAQGQRQVTINKENRSTTKDAVKREMDGRRALTTMGSTGKQ